MGWEKMKLCLSLLAFRELQKEMKAFFSISRFLYLYTVVRFNLPYSSCYCGEICNCVPTILQVCETIINIHLKDCISGCMQFDAL